MKVRINSMYLEVDEIILQVRKNNQEALGLLFSCFEIHFKVIENKYLFQFKSRGFTREDIRNILMNDIYDIIKIYEFDKGVFFSFWKMIQNQKIIRLFNSSTSCLNDENHRIDFEELDKIFLEKYTLDPLDNYALYDDFNAMMNRLENEEGIKTCQILSLWSEGYKYDEIAKMLNVSSQSVAYNINKAIKKLKSML